MRLPWLMEEILDAWDVAKKRPQFKAEYMITHNIVGALEAAARAAAARLKLSDAETEKLVAHYLGYTRELRGRGREAGAAVSVRDLEGQPRPLPEVYREVIIPMFAGDEACAARARDAHGRRRAHLHQARARPAGRHRAGRGAVLS